MAYVIGLLNFLAQDIQGSILYQSVLFIYRRVMRWFASDFFFSNVPYCLG